MSLLQSISLALKSRHVKSPLRIERSEIADYIAKSKYSWNWSTNGYVGTLERGFGRSYVMELNTQNNCLKVFEKTDFSFLGIKRKRNVESEFSKLSEDEVRKSAEAISDCIRNEPPPAKVTLAALLLGLLILIVIGSSRD